MNQDNTKIDDLKKFIEQIEDSCYIFEYKEYSKDYSKRLEFTRRQMVKYIYPAIVKAVTEHLLELNLEDNMSF